MDRQYRDGLFYAWIANLTWGTFPLIFKQLEGVPPASFVGYRLVYTIPFLLIVLAIAREYRAVANSLTSLSVLKPLLVSTTMMGLSWGTYLWCVQNDRIVEASLGYYLTPIFNVLIGFAFFSERVSRVQWFGILLAAAGVFYMAGTTGYVPWFGILLGLAFAVYGGVRKLATIDAMPGVFVENLLMLPIGIGILLFIPVAGGHASLPQGWVLFAAIISIIPIIWYVAAAKRISLITLGNLFYVAPSIGFLIGVFFNREPFTFHHAVMFGAIWLGLIIYGLDAWRRRA